jgi:hypothetical protein
VLTNRRYDLSPADPMLRVPYDLWRANGPAVFENGLVEVPLANGREIARTRPGRLGEAHPGERVLVQHPDTEPDPRQWWLSEVEAVEGHDAT